MPYLTMSDETKLYYETSGDGETLLFCHGLNSSHEANKEFYDEFRKDYKTSFMTKEIMQIPTAQQFI